MTPRSGSCPHTVTFCYEPWPEVVSGEAEQVQFRLIYQGRLPAQSQTDCRTKEKHEIRKVLHKQLRQLWDKHPFLSEKKETLISDMYPSGTPPSITGGTHCDHTGRNPPRRSVVDLMADNYAKCGYRFVPLVSSYDGVACALDILFLRRDDPGNLIQSGGDIDNRIKVLFDALRIPRGCQELAGQNPTEDENPFFCLLEDDRLITEVKVTTDRLLLPPGEGDHLNDVHLVIHVRTLVLVPKAGWYTAFLT